MRACVRARFYDMEALIRANGSAIVVLLCDGEWWHCEKSTMVAGMWMLEWDVDITW